MGDSVHWECITGWPVVEYRWIFVSAAGTLTDAAKCLLVSRHDITGNTRYPSHDGEIEQIEEPINASDMLKCIEQSQEVAESIRANEDLVCRLAPLKVVMEKDRFCV